MRLVLVMILVLMSPPVAAHKDRVIAISDDGALVGIPDEFGPAQLLISFSTPGDNNYAVSHVELRLGKSMTDLPRCLTALLKTLTLDDVRATASWYHDTTHLPEYLNVKFFDPGYDKSRWANPGYSLLFNLRTAEMISFEILIVRDGGKSIQQLPVDTDELCTR